MGHPMGLDRTGNIWAELQLRSESPPQNYKINSKVGLKRND